MQLGLWNWLGKQYMYRFQHICLHHMLWYILLLELSCMLSKMMQCFYNCLRCHIGTLMLRNNLCICPMSSLLNLCMLHR